MITEAVHDAQAHGDRPWRGNQPEHVLAGVTPRRHVELVGLRQKLDDPHQIRLVDGPHVGTHC